MNPPNATIHRRRWAILAVVSLAVFVTVLDGTIVNVALPKLSLELGASTRQLQWIVDAYLLVFTGLLLAAGGLGDRYGRKRALVLGLVVFGATSALAGIVDSANALIAARALMGVGGALIFREYPDLWSIAGMVVIAIGGLLTLSDRRAATPLPPDPSRG